MREIPIKKYVRYLFGVAILLFFLNKLYFRPWIIENGSIDLLMIVTYSIPNLLEAIIGTLIFTGLLFQTRQYFNEKISTIKDIYIHIMAVSIVGFYVISQELTFHNIGGNNVYDPYDLIASIIGLAGTFAIIQLFGFTDKVEIDKTLE